MTNHSHPIDELATLAADDNELRRESLDRIRAILSDPTFDIRLLGYHDQAELPDGTPQLHELVQR